MKNNIDTYYLVNKEDIKIFREHFSLNWFNEKSYCWSQKEVTLIIIIEKKQVKYQDLWSWLTIDEYESIKNEEEIKLIDFKTYLRLDKLKRIIGDE